MFLIQFKASRAPHASAHSCQQRRAWASSVQREGVIASPVRISRSHRLPSPIRRGSLNRSETIVPVAGDDRCMPVSSTCVTGAMVGRDTHHQANSAIHPHTIKQVVSFGRKPDLPYRLGAPQNQGVFREFVASRGNRRSIMNSRQRQAWLSRCRAQFPLEPGAGAVQDEAAGTP
jgi:hypothetical protein